MALLTLVCFYLASWQITKANGIANVAEATGRTAQSPGPFIVTVNISNNIQVTRQYYFWLFGPTMRLPFQREYPEPNPVVMGGVQPLIIIQLDEDEELLGIADW